MGVLPNNSITQDSLVKSSQRSVLLCYLSRYLLLLLLSQKPKLRLLLPLKLTPIQVRGMVMEAMAWAMTTVDIHTDMAMDIMAEKRGPLKQNQKLKPVPMLGTDMEVTDTDIHTDTDTDVTMDTVVMATHMDTTDTTVKCHAIETVPAKTTLPSSL